MGADNGLSSFRHQAIVWNNVDFYLVVTNFSDSLIKIVNFENVFCEITAIWSRDMYQVISH